ncbi:MAG: alpha/beta fold hydrolase [Solirubrobacteraceae bacterium]
MARRGAAQLGALHAFARRAAARRALLTLCLAVLASLLLTASAFALNVTGTWNANYHCEAGWCAGQDFPAPGVVLEQAKGSSHVTNPPSASGTLSGNTLTLDGQEGSYTFHEVLTIAANGKSWSGSLSDSNGTSGTDTATRVSGPPGETISVSGIVHDVYEQGLAGVAVKLSGKSDAEEEISRTDVTDGAGRYSFEVPSGTYNVTTTNEPPEQNGGTFTVAKPAGAATISAGEIAPPAPPRNPCTGTAKESTCALSHLESGEQGTADFTYTYCTAGEREANGKPVTGCPIIFIPGFLGSRIACNTGELWPHLPTELANAAIKAEFGELLLEPDGVTNSGAPGSCMKSAAPIPGQAGVVGLAAGADIYQSTLNFLNRIVAHGPPSVEQGAYAFPYDWRKSPLIAAEALDEYVDQVLGKTGAAHVTLMAHSMGGLVLQGYVANAAHAKKVERAITLGTPYWGAPKSHTALFTAKSNEPKRELIGLDLLIRSYQLQQAARNMQGLYWLYPDGNFGPWLKVNLNGGTFNGLTVAPGSKSSLKLGAWLNSSEIGPWVELLGGTAQLERNAFEGHAALDGFQTNGVPYRIVVGVGVPTITGIEVTENAFEGARLTSEEIYEGTQWVKVTFGSGDGTVPALSATQGVSEGRPPLRESVPIDYECEVEHVALPGNEAIQKKLEGFLLKGDPITSGTVCPYTGTETEVVKLPGTGAVYKAASPEGVTVLAGKAVLTLQQAAAQRLVQIVPDGDGRTIVVTGSKHPVTLQVTGRNFLIRTQAIKSAAKGTAGATGPAHLYGPLKGTLQVGMSGAVTRNGKKVKPAARHRLPRTTAHVTRRGHLYIVRLTASGKGIAGTYVRIGKAAPKRYRHPLKLTKSQLRRLRFASVEALGNWERAKKAHVPR